MICRSLIALASVASIACSSAPPPAPESAEPVAVQGEAPTPAPEAPAAPETNAMGATAPDVEVSQSEKTCDVDALREGVKALEIVAADKKSPIALQILIEGCNNDLSFALDDVNSAPPDQQAVLIAKAIADNASLWGEACPGGVETFEKIAKMGPDGRAELMVEECDMGRHDFATAEELTNADGSKLPLAILYAHVFEKDGTDPAVYAPILRSLVGL